jgi:DNA-binding PadR family transcriptional regulator
MAAKLVADRGTGALRSPVSWALLGLVIQRPSYGYELVQRFERTFADALDLSSLSQIYTALDTLQRRSLIEEFTVDDESPHAVVRQPKPHYRATAEGVRHYEQWLVGQIHEERRRSRLFARQLSVLPPRTALGIVERCERACLDEARDALPATARSGRSRAAAGDARSASATASEGEAASEGASGLSDRLLCEEGRLAVEARLAWLEYARRELSALVGERAPGR